MRITLIVSALLLASCGGVSRLPSFTPHKIDVRQGNLITPDMRDKLKLGMSRAQVRAVLGSPLINDAFHANRWDYVYRLELDKVLVKQQGMTVYFDGDVLTRIDDGNMPLQVASAVVAAPAIVTPVANEIEPDEAPISVASSVAPASAEQAVKNAVQSWASAWSARDAEKHLAWYSQDFKPATGASRAAWAVQRKDRISKSETITVTLSDIKVTMLGMNRASVTFKQSYRANNHEDAMYKTLEMEKVGDAWLIVSERATEK